MSFTYVCFVTVFFGFDFIISVQVSTKSANASFPNIDFVEIVKENLRRNNEDYGEMKYDNNLTSNTEGSYGISKKVTITLKVRKNDMLKNNRRANVDSIEYISDDRGNSTTKEQQLTSNATMKVYPINEIFRSQTDKKIVKEKIAKKLNKIDIMKPIMLPTVKPISNATRNFKLKDIISKIPKFVNKNKIDKFKKFMSKNKGLLKDFMNSKIETLTQKTITKKPLNKKDLGNILKSRDKAIPRQKHETYHKIDETNLISPDLLDMAPARGARIHRQRVKGRLCQRHVLLPEGPKYDSQGKWYVPAHKLVVSRPYNVTLPPRILLPRCCNCCKKSVLGCE